MRVPGWKSVRQSARWLRSRLSSGALILGYHRVADLQYDPHGMAVCIEHFTQQLEVLTCLANPLPLAELVAGLNEGTLPPRAVAVTFDDGYADIFHHARPLLEQYQVPATVFVVTACLGAEFWWDREQNERAEEPPARAMTRSELLELLTSRLFDAGAHSATHPALAPMSLDEQRAEIELSKSELQTLLGRPVSGFTYPHGSVSDNTIRLVQAAGYDYACGSTPDVARRGSDFFCLPRFWVGDWDGARFERWLRRWLPASTVQRPEVHWWQRLQ